MAFSYGCNKKYTSREVNALSKLPKVHSCRRRVIVTFDEEASIVDKHGVIEVIPCWKWLLEVN